MFLGLLSRKQLINKISNLSQLFSNEQFTELAFIFEKMNNKAHSEYEERVINNSEFKNYEPSILEKLIVDGLNLGLYTDESRRVSAYWALMKRDNKKLIPLFQRFLKSELDLKSETAVYQILIALDRLDEQVFSENRNGSSSVSEVELNLNDAMTYVELKM